VEKNLKKMSKKSLKINFDFLAYNTPRPQKNFSPIGQAGHPFISQKFKGTVVDRTNGGSLEILHTIPFI